MNKFIFFVLQFFLLIPLAFSADRYVRCTSGSNSNDGSSLPNAFLTIQKCVDVSSSGDRCLVSDNEICTGGWSTETGFTKNNVDKAFTITNVEDGGTAEIDFPDNRPNIESVAVIDLSGITTQFGGINARDNTFIYKNLKITIPNHEYGIYTGGYPYWKNVEFNDTGLSGDKKFFYQQFSQNQWENCFFNKANTRGQLLAYDANGGVIQRFVNNYFRWGQFSISMTIGKYANSSPDNFKGNVFEVTNAYSTTYPILALHGYLYNEVENNTFIGNGIANLKAVKIWDYGYGAYFPSFKDNLFYGFNGSGASSISWHTGVDFNIADYGNNGFFNSVTPEAIPASATIINNLTASDIIESEDPFTDISNGDLSLISDYRGTSSIDKDIGAIQSQQSSGGGSTIKYILISE